MKLPAPWDTRRRPVSPNRLALDACVLINLCATERTAEIAATLNVRFVVPRQVSDETFFLRPPNGIGEPRIAIELDALVDEGALEIVDLSSDELIIFVAAAARLDDGEAAVLSVAVHRGLALATDDRAALRLIAVRHPTLKTVSTSQLMRRYCEQAPLAADEAAACVVAIEARASSSHPPRTPRRIGGDRQAPTDDEPAVGRNHEPSPGRQPARAGLPSRCPRSSGFREGATE